jgi:peptide/nickel transport system substrate-binding protein
MPSSNRRRSEKIAPLVCAAALALLAAFGPAQAQTPVHGGVLTMGMGGDLTTLNPTLTSTIAETMFGCGIYEGLVEIGADFKVRPLLAKSWTISDDGLTYSFDLNKAKWQDGKDFTSADVAYSLIDFNAKASPMFKAAGALIDKIDTPTTDKAIIHVKRSSGTFLQSLACIQGGAIMPEHIFKGTDPRSNPASNNAPVGTGPFKLTAWKRGDSLELTRNADYWDTGKPYLDKIIAKVMPQATSRLQALQAGEIDFIQGWNVAPSDEAVVKANADLQLHKTGYAPAAIVVGFNNDKPMLSDVRVRQALFMATDRDYLLRTTWFGDGTVSIQPFNASIKWAANPDIDFRKMYPFDVARANKLLDDAGYAKKADGTRFVIHISVSSDSPERLQAATALKAMWRNVGIDVQIETLERAVYYNQVFTARQFDIFIEGLNTFGDPALGITRIYDSAAIGRVGGNAAGYKNPEVDKLFKEAEETVDTDKRGDYYKQSQVILAKDVPVMPVRDYSMTDAAWKGLHDVWGVLGPADWRRAWMEKK